MTISTASKNNFPKARFGPSYLSTTMEKIFKWSASGIHCERLEGDASERSYFRVSQKNSGGAHGMEVQKSLQSLIIMQLEKPVIEGETDFTRVLKFLRALDLPAPELFYYDIPKGLLFLEDCGTMTLEDQLNASPQSKAQLYRQAVELLVCMQSRATHSIDSTCPAYHRKFDVKKLMWEFDFMLEHYVGGFCKSSLESFAKKELREAFLSLCELIAAEKLYFTHRDYHSRNLMVDENRLVLIDFQDARMGLCQYDLVSLLRDSYTEIDNSLFEELVEFYICLKEKEEGQEGDVDQRVAARGEPHRDHRERSARRTLRRTQQLGELRGQHLQGPRGQHRTIDPGRLRRLRHRSQRVPPRQRRRVPVLQAPVDRKGTGNAKRGQATGRGRQ